MSNLDYDGQQLLARLSTEDADLFRDVPDATGADHADRLAVTVDSARRVVAVDVRDVARLRTPEDLAAAVREAFAAADGQRALASLTEAGKAEDRLAHADALVSGRRKLQVRSAPDVSYQAYVERGGRHRARVVQSAAAARPDATTSDNGYVSIVRDEHGMVSAVHADGEWLSAAQPHHLERALQQAGRWTTRQGL
ncbi:hypothetical protein [Nocardioides sp. LHG3406-4]|uniref:hypothetical protein n=1 Tax=Nocardioides sp. LHG3406-4 TaxID=2804575 RepID=UPI003CECA072